ncbi:MAG TPA: hypothetical protein DCQ98_06030 [Planctomycetaceae bacterium]|nr:hypothetical protein [Planctomycetaceae bacterium]HRF01686.1 hypothetical protein [Pirellulaceae bacterium]
MTRSRIALNVAALVLLVVLGLRSFGGSVLPLPLPIAVTPKPGSWVLVIEESAERTTEVAKLVADQAWLDALKARQAKWRILDDDQPEAAPYVAAVGPTRPTVLILGPDGAVLATSDQVSRNSIDQLLKDKAGL